MRSFGSMRITTPACMWIPPSPFGLSALHLLQGYGLNDLLIGLDCRSRCSLGPLLITSEDPEAGEFVPREEDIPKEDSVTESTTIKGQVYQWKNEDEGFVSASEAQTQNGAPRYDHSPLHQ